MRKQSPVVAKRRRSQTASTIQIIQTGNRENLHTINRRNRRQRYLSPFSRFAMRAIVSMLPATAIAADLYSDQATVIDGDTIQLEGQTIRLYGVDAPELQQLCRRSTGSFWPCGKQARLNLQILLTGKLVSCVGFEDDRVGNLVATCNVDDGKGGQHRISQWLVEEGWAVPNPDPASQSSFGPHKDSAEREKRGIWSGTFTNPWTWRESKQGNP